MKYISVVLAIPVFSEFYYKCSAGSIKPGCRVKVPFGKTSRTGYTVEVFSKKPSTRHPLKEIKEVIDGAPILTDELMELSCKISRYYVAPRGMVLSAMLPAALKPMKREPKFTIDRADTAIKSP
ncbi:MAG: hypothetical protein U9R36_07275, partial [Elusimicrobiota bacterium]|nr:hypothetical protein [Elusimicrobiota bacterium]